MSGFNMAVVCGNVGQEPELRHMPNGDQLCNLSIATSERWTDKTTGEPRELIEWHRITLSGKQAEIAGKYVTKGSKVLVRGRIRTRKWIDKQGGDRYTTEIRCDELTLLGDGQKYAGAPVADDSSTPPPQRRPVSTGEVKTRAKPMPIQGHDSAFGDMEDDIPF